ncbi:hypothetical protein L0152_13645 [bacterium]|nr:hypothetical protein [bacterium]
MNSLLVTFASFVLCALICEIPLRFAKIQSALLKILFIHFMIASLTYIFLLSLSVNLSSFLILWSGAFLTWFGIRSHIESSILLRLLSILKPAPMTSAELIKAYEKQHGIAVRREELIRSGLVEAKTDGFRLTSKGRVILAIASFLREAETERKELQAQNLQ